MPRDLKIPDQRHPEKARRPDSAQPMVLLVHGGPWARDHWGYNSLHQWLASRGYAVMSVNYRGSTGFGKGVAVPHVKHEKIQKMTAAIGRMIVAMANRIGVTPIAFVRSEEAVRNLAHLSAEVVRYSDDEGVPPFDDRRPSSGQVDVVFDCVGGAGALALSRWLRPNGRFVHYGLFSGNSIPSGFWSARPDIDYAMFHLRNWVRAVHLEQVHRTYADVASLIADGIIRTPARAAYPLDDLWPKRNLAEKATQWLEERLHFSLAEYPEYWGSVHLVAPNPVFREVSPSRTG